ncbi:MAG: hypothetical protein J6S85_25190 [Methanobrevibacter sp.]|nr:hypothetical protein [Methanobrevibacter sp.]
MTQENEQEKRIPLAQNLEDNLYTPDNYLIDLGLLKDFRVGALMVLLNRHPKGTLYNEIFMKNLLYYQNRSFHEICCYIDNCPVTEEDIDNLLADEKEHDLIYWCSPVTNVIGSLYASILYNVNHSAVKEKWKKVKVGSKTYLQSDRITFHINTYPLKLSPRAIVTTLTQIVEVFKVDVKFIYTAPMSYTQEEYDLYDEMFLLDSRSMLECEWFVKQPPILIPPQKKSLKAPPLLSREWKENFNRAKVQKLMKIVKATLHISLDIDWLPFRAYALDESLYDEDIQKIEEEDDNGNVE